MTSTSNKNVSRKLEDTSNNWRCMSDYPIPMKKKKISSKFPYESNPIFTVPVSTKVRRTRRWMSNNRTLLPLHNFINDQWVLDITDRRISLKLMGMKRTIFIFFMLILESYRKVFTYTLYLPTIILLTLNLSCNYKR